MGCAVHDQGANNQMFKEQLGLVTGHAYGLLAACEVPDANGETVKIVKIRNPWGKFEWTGEWSDSSDTWTPEAREIANFDDAVDDGSFWMSKNDFKACFGSFCICQYETDNVFCSVPVTQREETVSTFKMEIDTPGVYSFAVN